MYVSTSCTLMLPIIVLKIDSKIKSLFVDMFSF